jgi:O-acetyl-ADP-ribose deacetylase (regulator of RNase III)
VIRVLLQDLAITERDATLRPVSAEWTAVTPSMRRLEVAAGPRIEEQCRAMGELPVGSAIITSAGALAARFMVHVVVRSMDEQVTEHGVRRGLQNGLRRLAEWGIHTVAMPPLGTGAGNLDADESAAIIIPVLREQLRVGGPPSGFHIFVDSDYDRDVFETHVRAASPGSG